VSALIPGHAYEVIGWSRPAGTGCTPCTHVGEVCTPVGLGAVCQSPLPQGMNLLLSVLQDIDDQPVEVAGVLCRTGGIRCECHPWTWVSIPTFRTESWHDSVLPLPDADRLGPW
jgi:hypothetical protein